MSAKIAKPVHYGEVIELEIASLAFGGEAVGRYKDFAVFVPGGLPGEVAQVRVTQVKDNYASGEILRLLQRSPDRVTPLCPIFEECGGCQWQHLHYSKQLQTKRQFVVDALGRIGHLNSVTVQPCLPSANPYAYRNKALPVLSMRDGHFVAGIFEPRSHRLVPYQTCPIQNDALNDLIQKTLRKIDLAGLTPYQEKKHTGFLRHLAVRHGARTGETLLAFVTRTETPEERVQKPTILPEPLGETLPRLARELMEETPGLVGVLQNINPSRTNVVFGPVTRTLSGRSFYHESLDGMTFRVSLESFLQVNTPQAEILHEVVREALGRPNHGKKWGTVLDLYGGIGTLGLAVASSADYVVGVEEVAAAVEDAKANVQLNHKGNVDILEGDVASVLLKLKDRGLKQIDAAILDPPRKGVLPEILARITALRPERLVYVSCDPSTLARDLALLSKHGYETEWAQPLDMFPQTYHVETVARLTRKAPLSPEALPEPVEKREELFRPLEKEEGLSSAGVGENLGKARREAARSLKSLAAAGLSLVSLAAGSLKEAVGDVGGILNRIGRRFRSAFKAESSRASGFRRGGGDVSGAHADPGDISQGTSFPNGGFIESRELGAKGREETAQEAQPPQAFQSEALPEGWFPASLEEESKILLNVRVQPASVTEDGRGADPLSAGTKGTQPVLPALGAAESGKPTPLFSAPIQEVELSREGGRFWSRTFFKLKTPLAFPAPTKNQKRAAAGFLAALLTGGTYLAMATLPTPGARNQVKILPVPTAVSGITAVLPTRPYLRYEMIPFEVRLSGKDLANLPHLHAVAEVYQGGHPVSMVDGKTKLYLNKDYRNKLFTGNWPIPYNPSPGTYFAQVSITGPKMASPKLFRSVFTIPPLKPRGLFPGYCALTMEGGKQLLRGMVLPFDGKSPMSATNAMDWAKFMGANVFCFLLGQTSIWDKLNPRDFPFNGDTKMTGRRYGKAAHEAGLKFAAYITTFKVVGDGWKEAPYDFSLGYDFASDKVAPTRFISLNDPKRRQDVVGLLREMDQDPSIDLIGMDYVRTGFAGYEMVEEFVRDLDVPLPPHYWSMTKEDRVHWLARTVERKEDRDVVALFEWWRAHKVALVLKGILEEAKLSKPVFTFTLGWKMGHQHGQDPAMLVDAGVNFNQIMLYEGTRDQLENMNRQWPDYLARGNGMYALGEMVDYNWVQRSLNPPGPQELYNRQVETFRSWFPVNAHLGMFWHDLYRMFYGFRGPYSTMEWVIAGGKAFSYLKQNEGMSPVEVDLSAPPDAPAGASVSLGVEIKNLSTGDLKGLVFHQLDPSKNYFSELASMGPFDLAAGGVIQVKNLSVTLPKESHPKRDNRFMAAVLVEKPGGSIKSFDFVYIKALRPGEKSPPADAGPKVTKEEDSQGSSD